MLAATWRLARRTTAANALLACAAAVACVQCLYQNAFFVLAACVAGMALCARDRRGHDMLVVLGIGLIAALSLTPYVGPLLRAQDWWLLEKTGFRPWAGWQQASLALGSPLAAYKLIWVVLWVFGLGFGVWRALCPSTSDGRDLIAFCSLALLSGTAGFV